MIITKNRESKIFRHLEKSYLNMENVLFMYNANSKLVSLIYNVIAFMKNATFSNDFTGIFCIRQVNLTISKSNFTAVMDFSISNVLIKTLTKIDITITESNFKTHGVGTLVSIIEQSTLTISQSTFINKRGIGLGLFDIAASLT